MIGFRVIHGFPTISQNGKCALFAVSILHRVISTGLQHSVCLPFFERLKTSRQHSFSTAASKLLQQSRPRVGTAPILRTPRRRDAGRGNPGLLSERSEFADPAGRRHGAREPAGRAHMRRRPLPRPAGRVPTNFYDFASQAPSHQRRLLLYVHTARGQQFSPANDAHARDAPAALPRNQLD